MSRYISPTPEQYREPREKYDWFNAELRAGYNPHWNQPGDRSGHDGVDFSSRFRTPSVAVADGYVHWAGSKVLSNPSAGKFVELLHDFRDVGGDLEMSRALHHDELLVVAGEVVEQGEQIGYVGHTGLANYDHVHMGLLRLDGGYNPDKSGIWHSRYGGAVWLDPRLEGMFGQPVQPPSSLPFPVTRPPVVKFGPPYATDPNVQDLQAMLARRGFLSWEGNNLNGVFDGMAGPRTQHGVRSFQTSKQLVASGLVDDATWQALLTYP
jgi:murein DD-endopeptidase MepM/ murein hydrolase activator NlpD